MPRPIGLSVTLKPCAISELLTRPGKEIKKNAPKERFKIHFSVQAVNNNR